MPALSGMKAICKFMNRSDATILDLHRSRDFPMRKIGGIWESDTDLIDKWRKRLIERGVGDPTPGLQRRPQGKKTQRKKMQRK
jgi:hypothetical protein